MMFQSTPACGRQRPALRLGDAHDPVSIHSRLHEREAVSDAIFRWPDNLFQSTPACGRQEVAVYARRHEHDVSIHSHSRETSFVPVRSEMLVWFQSTPACDRQTYERGSIDDGVLFNPLPRAGDNTT